MSLATFEAAVRPLLAELEASANARDTDRHMAVYVRDRSLTFVFNGGIVRGWDALREQQRQWWSDGKAKVAYRYHGDPLFELVAEDAGLTTVLIASRREMDDGSVVERMLAHTAVWRRLAEGWRITHAHESSSR